MVTKKQQIRSDKLMDVLDNRSKPHLFDAVNEKWFKDSYKDYLKNTKKRRTALKKKVKKKTSTKAIIGKVRGKNVLIALTKHSSIFD